MGWRCTWPITAANIIITSTLHSTPGSSSVHPFREDGSQVTRVPMDPWTHGPMDRWMRRRHLSPMAVAIAIAGLQYVCVFVVSFVLFWSCGVTLGKSAQSSAVQERFHLEAAPSAGGQSAIHSHSLRFSVSVCFCFCFATALLLLLPCFCFRWNDVGSDAAPQLRAFCTWSKSKSPGQRPSLFSNKQSWPLWD